MSLEFSPSPGVPGEGTPKSYGSRIATCELAMPHYDLSNLPPDWRAVLADELARPYFQELSEFVEKEAAAHTLFPSPDDLYSAFRYTPFDRVRVLILGQDPYHDVGQAHGLCFSVREGVKPPPSLVNIFKELKSDIGIDPPRNGCLTRWAEQGVLLLNAVLTVRAHEANSHKDRGWEKFTDAVIDAVNRKSDPVIFVLWGGYARKKESRIDTTRHAILQSAHPSPLSAHNGFFGSKPFSKTNDLLERFGKPRINW